MEPAGRDPGRAFGAPRSRTRDALFPEEVQSFPDNFSARLGHGSERHLRILFGLRRHQAPSPPKPRSGTIAGGAGSRMGPIGPCRSPSPHPACLIKPHLYLIDGAKMILAATPESAASRSMAAGVLASCGVP